MWLGDHGLGNDSAVLKHVLQVHQVAVMLLLREIIGIMEMDDAFFMGCHNLLRKKDPARQVFGNLSRHIVALGGIDGRILI